MNPRLKNLMAAVAHRTGAVALLRRLARRPGARRGYHVFCYHRIGEGRGPFFPGVPVAAFEAQCAFLARRYRVLPLPELAARARHGEPLADAVALTFDDGYRDNLELALPVLEKYHLPATIFLATGAIGTGAPLWHDRVAGLVERTARPRLALALGGARSVFELDSLAARLAAVERLLGVLKRVPEAEKLDAIEALRREAGVPDDAGLAGDMLDWEDVRHMAGRGITFGAHTVNHPILTRLPLAEARREILESARRIEAETARPATTFAYPNGFPGDFNPALERCLAAEGFVCAVSRGFEPNPPGGNLYDIRRWTPYPYTLPMLALRMEWTSRRI